MFGTPRSCPVVDILSGPACAARFSNSTGGCPSTPVLLALLKLDCFVSPVFHAATSILAMVGTVLNAFTTYCFFKMYKRDSQNIFLYVLSISDTINLHVNFALPMLRQWEKFDDYLRNVNVLCRLVGVLTEFSLIFPVWILVLLTVDRLVHVLRLMDRPLSHTRRRAKMSLLILAGSVLAMSVYRLFDVKGIDQSSVFAILACKGKHYPLLFLRDLNLLVGMLFPLFVTLILSVTMIYRIETTAKKCRNSRNHARATKYDQTTKTTLLISILFPTFFHTPNGIMIILDLLYGHNSYTTNVVLILVGRKLTMILCEISAACKFFVYINTYPHFKEILRSLFQCARRRRSSLELSQPALLRSHGRSFQNAVRFGHHEKLLSFSDSRTTSSSRSTDRHSHHTSRGESLSRTFPEQHSLIYSTTRSFDDLDLC